MSENAEIRPPEYPVKHGLDPRTVRRIIADSQAREFDESSPLGEVLARYGVGFAQGLPSDFQVPVQRGAEGSGQTMATALGAFGLAYAGLPIMPGTHGRGWRQGLPGISATSTILKGSAGADGIESKGKTQYSKYLPSITYKGKNYVGKAGQLHSDVIEGNKIPYSAKGIISNFYDTTTGKVVSRKQAETDTGTGDAAFISPLMGGEKPPPDGSKGQARPRSPYKVFGKELMVRPEQGARAPLEEVPVLLHSTNLSAAHDMLVDAQSALERMARFTTWAGRKGRVVNTPSGTLGKIRSFTTRPEVRGPFTDTPGQVTFVVDRAKFREHAKAQGGSLLRMVEAPAPNVEGPLMEVRRFEPHYGRNVAMRDTVPLSAIKEIQVMLPNLGGGTVGQPLGKYTYGEMSSRNLSSSGGRLLKLTRIARELGIPVVLNPTLGGKPGTIRKIPDPEEVHALLAAKLSQPSMTIEDLKQMREWASREDLSDESAAMLLNKLEPRTAGTYSAPLSPNYGPRKIGPGGLSRYAGENKVKGYAAQIAEAELEHRKFVSPKKRP